MQNRNEPLKRRQERALRERAPHLRQARPPVLPREPAEAAVAEYFRQFARPDRSEVVPFSRERYDGARPGFDAAGYSTCQVDAKKREGGIGYRVNQAPAVCAGRFRQLHVLPPKRHQLNGRLDTKQPRHAVGPEPSAVDEHPRLDGAATRLSHGRSLPLRAAENLGGRSDLAASLFNALGQTLGYSAEIDHACFGNVQGGDSCCVRLNFFQSLGADPFGMNAICLCTFVKCFQSWEFVVRNRDNRFPADGEGDAFLLTEGFHFLFPLSAELRLRRSRGVVHAGMEHPGVPPCLMATNLVFLLKDDQQKVRV